MWLMLHLMRAEYDTDQATGPVKSWHMVRDEEAVAMCGRRLPPDGETRPDGGWGTTAEPPCHTCGALYLREVP